MTSRCISAAKPDYHDASRSIEVGLRVRKEFHPFYPLKLSAKWLLGSGI